MVSPGLTQFCGHKLPSKQEREMLRSPAPHPTHTRPIAASHFFRESRAKREGRNKVKALRPSPAFPERVAGWLPEFYTTLSK